jgi:biopolymer transport protein ExbB/TolQ
MPGGEFFRSGQWITPAIHGYALIAFAMMLLVLFLHRYRLAELARRITVIVGLVENRVTARTKVVGGQVAGAILNLEDRITRQPGLDIRPVLDYLRRDDRHRAGAGVGNLVHLFETWIELFPMLGIFGTVWGFAGVGGTDFSSGTLLAQFAVATSTTLYALMYVIVFRIVYAAFIVGSVDAFEEAWEKYAEFLAFIERRCADLPGATIDLAGASSVGGAGLPPSSALTASVREVGG